MGVGAEQMKVYMGYYILLGKHPWLFWAGKNLPVFIATDTLNRLHAGSLQPGSFLDAQSHRKLFIADTSTNTSTNITIYQCQYQYTYLQIPISIYQYRYL